jgi:hypothetical protein
MDNENKKICQLNPISCGAGEADVTTTFYRGDTGDIVIPDEAEPNSTTPPLNIEPVLDKIRKDWSSSIGKSWTQQK